MSLGSVSYIAVLAALIALGNSFYDYHEEYHTCCAWGDPHYNTYDGATIHFQGICRYLLTGTCPCSKVRHQFKVFVENEPISGTIVSRTRLVDIEIYDYRVRFKENGIVEMWNPAGTWFSPFLPYTFEDATITRSGYTLRFETDDGITVQYSGNHRVCVRVPCKYREEMCGICGNLNLDEDDDYQTSNNIEVPQNQYGYDLIGNSWQVDPLAYPQTVPDHCFEEPEKPTGQMAVVPATSNKYCEGMIEKCPAARKFYGSCLYEVGAQPDDEHAHCQAVETALQECGRLPESWRKEFNCPCPNGRYSEPCGPCPDGSYSDPCKPACVGRLCAAQIESVASQISVKDN